jgi:hypothetical protein
LFSHLFPSDFVLLEFTLILMAVTLEVLRAGENWHPWLYQN